MLDLNPDMLLNQMNNKTIEQITLVYYWENSNRIWNVQSFTNIKHLHFIKQPPQIDVTEIELPSVKRFG